MFVVFGAMLQESARPLWSTIQNVCSELWNISNLERWF